MRLPWLQIDADGMTRGEMLGRLLGIGPDAGIGFALRLWRWALEMSPEGDFSGGQHEPRNVAAAVGWDPDQAEKLLAELEMTGLVEMPVGAGLARIRGLERYRRAWEKNQRRKPALKVPATGATGAGYRAEPARKTETETETEKKRTAAAAVEKPPPITKPPPPMRPVPADKFANAESFWAWAQSKRVEVGLLNERFPAQPRALSAWWSEVGMALGGNYELLEEAWYRFGADPHWKTRAPPAPFAGFMSQWSKFIPQHEVAHVQT